ncbi:MAG: Ig-like domain-containing protein, partial [Acidobacteriota bacterium]
MLSFDGGGTAKGSFTTSSGATTRFDGSTKTYTLNAGTYFDNAGSIQITSILDVNADVELSGVVTISGGGAIQGAGNLTISGAMDWQSGTMSGTGTTQIASTGTLNISGASSKTLTQRVINNSGTVNWSARVAGGSDARLNNLAGATIAVQATGITHFDFTSGVRPTLTNAGKIILKAGTAATFEMRGPFTQTASGELEVEVVGPAPNQCDKVNLIGTGVTATLGGKLSIIGINYTPTITDQFTVLQAPILTGTFQTVSNTNSTLRPSYTTIANAVVLKYNQVPIAQNATVATLEENAVSGTLGATDADASDTLTYSIIANGSKGTAVLDPANSNSFTYTPNPDENGTDTFTFKASDGANSATAVITVEISPVNDAPSFDYLGNDETLEDEPREVFGWATQIMAGPPNESGQALNFIVSTNNDALFYPNGLPAISTDGTLTYTPAPNASGEALVSVDLQDDGGTANGGVDQYSVSFLITILAVNDPPTFLAGPDQTVNQDSGSHVVPDWATGISTGPANESGQTLSFIVTSD